uniref:Amino acid transporter transmembrane domain-containing protein n=1 Tax=Panagrolaimus superbus TaxID=310955 RepID=A0A914YMR8_9BILA
MIGPGCLALPAAFKQAGLWTGFIMVFCFGLLNKYCMLQLVNSSQYLSRKKGDAKLDFGAVAYEAFDNSFERCKKFKNIANAIGNVFMITVLAVVFQYLVQDSKHTSELPWITNFNGVMSAAGSILYAFEGQSIVLVMENKLKHPEDMCGQVGVLSTGMNLVIIVYAACGFFGFAKYGSEVKGSITLDLPKTVEFTTVKVLLIIIVFFGSLIQFYVIIDMTWPTIRRFLTTKFFSSKFAFPLELCYRAILVTVTMVIAIAIPNLEEIIPLVGVTAGMSMAFFYPPVIDTITFLPGLLQKYKRASEDQKFKVKISIIFRLFRNGCLIFVACFGCIAGLNSAIRDLINTHSSS